MRKRAMNSGSVIRREQSLVNGELIIIKMIWLSVMFRQNPQMPHTHHHTNMKIFIKSINCPFGELVASQQQHNQDELQRN